MVNTAKPPLDKKEVRQALSYSLNRVELVKTAFFGVSKPITTTFYSPASLAYREDLVMAHAFDLDEGAQTARRRRRQEPGGDHGRHAGAGRR